MEQYRSEKEQGSMASEKTTSQEATQTSRADADALQTAQANQAGAEFEWHYGRLTRIGYFGEVGGRQITIMWEEGDVTSQQGEISDEQWEIFKLAFQTTRRIAVLSDAKNNAWEYDYRFLEVVG
jgi:hypothetical protein